MRFYSTGENYRKASLICKNKIYNIQYVIFKLSLVFMITLQQYDSLQVCTLGITLKFKV